MNEAWEAWAQYKMLADKINELKMQVWRDLPVNEEIEISIAEAEDELAKLKAWIEINFETQKLD